MPPLRLERWFEISTMITLTTAHPDHMIRAGAIGTKRLCKHPLEIATESDCETFSAIDVWFKAISVQLTIHGNSLAVEIEIHIAAISVRGVVSAP